MLVRIENPVAYGWTLEYVHTGTWETVVENYGPDADPKEIETRKSELRASGYVPFSEMR